MTVNSYPPFSHGLSRAGIYGHLQASSSKRLLRTSGMWPPSIKAAALGGLRSLFGARVPGLQVLPRALMEEGSVVLCSGQPPGMATPWNLAVAVFLIPQPRKGHIRSSLFGFFIVF